MGAPLEIAGAHKRTEKGNVDEYYGGGSVAYASTAAACAFVPFAIREGKTVGVWENGKVVEYTWHTDTSDSGLTKKTLDIQPASATQAGTMSASDFSKLGGIAAGATADQAANTAETINGTDKTKYVTAFNLAAWWTDVKTRIQTFTNLVNFIGGVQKNGKDVATVEDVNTATAASLKRTTDTFDGLLDFATNGADKKGLRWATNSDYGRIYLRSTSDLSTQFILEIGDNGAGTPEGALEGLVVVKNAAAGATPPYTEWDMFTITPSELSYNPDNAGKRVVWHSGLLPKGTAGQSIRVKADGSAFEAFDPGDTAAIAAKEDKLISFATTQTASFDVAANMVDKTVRCNHATVAITATLADDNLFAIGAKFVVRQIGVAPVTLAAASGINLHAPQGLTLSKQYCNLLVVKQAANTYSVTMQGDDPNKVDKEAGKTLYPASDQTKLANIITGFTVSFSGDHREFKDYFEVATSVVQIRLDGATAIQYSLNNGSSYTTPTLPLTAAIAIPAGTWVRWRITYAAGSAIAAAYIKII